MTAASKDHKDREHAICSASSAERWLNCPGSVCMSQGIPEPPPSSYALEGTRAHELSEKILRHWKDNGRKLDYGFVDTLRPEYADTEFPTADGRTWSMVDFALTYVHLCIDETEQFDKAPAVALEQRLTLDEGMKMFGTADFLATGPRGGEDVGVIVDLKYGRGKKVKTKGNDQLLYYAVALRKTSKKKLQRIKVRVVQPRLDEYFGEEEYGTEDLDAGEQKLILGAEKALWQAATKKPELRRGGWCWFCPAKSICPEYGKGRAEEAVAAFPDDLAEEAVPEATEAA